MKKSDMLNELIAYYSDGNKAKFAQKLGIKAQTINSCEKRETFDHELLYASLDDISGDWLLSGEGEMLKSKRFANTEQGNNSELIDLCKQLVLNYQQREEVVNKLVSLIR